MPVGPPALAVREGGSLLTEDVLALALRPREPAFGAACPRVDWNLAPCQPSGRHTLPLGIWVPEPDLQPQETVLATINANRTQGRRAVGGRLFLTTTHLRFVAHRFDRMLGGRDLAILRREISSASVADRSGVGDVFAGGTRRRLQVDARGSVELFVVNRLDQVVVRFNAWLEERYPDR